MPAPSLHVALDSATSAADLRLLGETVGLFCWFAFATTAHHFPVGAISRQLARLIIPLTLAGGGLLVFDLGWRALALVALLFLLAGVVHRAARAWLRPSRIYTSQRVFGVLGVLGVVAGWLLHYA